MATWDFLTGFETGAITSEPGYVTHAGSVAIESSIVRTGGYSLKLTPASGATGYVSYSAPGGAAYSGRFYLRVTTLPGTARQIYGGNGAGVLNLVLNPSGTIAYRSATTTIGTSSTALTDTSRWYRIDFRGDSAASVNVLWIDGTAEVTGNAANANVGIAFGDRDNTTAATYTAYVDDAVWAGAADAPIGAGGSIVLLPSSISAAGGWVEGDGAGTAGIVGAISTKPPPGVASASETSATNMESATNSATDNIDLTMQSYTTGGIGASDTVNAVTAIVRHGEDIATGTKGGSVQITSNPAEGAETSFNYGGDGGAHAGEVGVWVTGQSTLTAAPSLTFANQPVVRIGKRTATTRVVCVDFVGIYVDYTPAAAPAVTIPSLVTPRSRPS